MAAPKPPVLVAAVGLVRPQSVLHDPVADVYLVANLGQKSAFISAVRPDGSVRDLRFIDGARGVLASPRGMAIVEDRLLVADGSAVRVFDRGTGAPLSALELPQSGYLADVAAGPDGQLYVVDSGKPLTQPGGSGTLWVAPAGGKAQRVSLPKELGRPAAVWVDQRELVVAGLGGTLSRHDFAGHSLSVEVGPAEGLAGVVATREGFWLVASADREIVFIAAGGDAGEHQFVPLVEDFGRPGDIGYDAERNQVLVPFSDTNTVYIQQVVAGEVEVGEAGDPGLGSGPPAEPDLPPIEPEQ